MRDRLKVLLPNDFESINIHTFHSLCFSILKENAQKAGLSQEFKVITSQEKELLKDEIKVDEMLEFDDLITLTVKLFEENSDIREIYQNRFKNISDRFCFF